MAEAIPVPAGALPPTPPGAVVHSRDNPAPVPAPAPAAGPAPAPAAPAADQDLTALLAALKGAAPTPQPAPAPAPAADIPAPVAGPDPVSNALQGVLVSNGLDVQRLLAKAVEHGDPSLVDYNYLKEKGGANADQLRSVVDALVQHQLAQEAQIEQDVYTRFGGESNWDAALAFFAAKAEPATKEYVVGMLRSRNPALVRQASNIVLDAVRGAGVTITPAGLANGGLPSGGTGGEAPLGKEAFKQEIAKLDPNARDFVEKRRQLYVRRSAGKQLGM